MTPPRREAGEAGSQSEALEPPRETPRSALSANGRQGRREHRLLRSDYKSRRASHRRCGPAPRSLSTAQTTAPGVRRARHALCGQPGCRHPGEAAGRAPPLPLFQGLGAFRARVLVFRGPGAPTAVKSVPGVRPAARLRAATSGGAAAEASRALRELRCAFWAAAAQSRLKRCFAGTNGARRAALRSVPLGEESRG